MILGFRGAHFFLSNFYPAPLDWWGQVWPTAEHAYQAAKSDDPDERAVIAAAETPGRAKRLGRCVKLRAGWDAQKVDVMRSILEAKFAVPDLAARLVATGTAPLLELNTWGDRTWGVVARPDGTIDGRNLLGALLMERRAALIAARFTLFD